MSKLKKIIKSKWFLTFYFGVKSKREKLRNGLRKEIIDYHTDEIRKKVKYMGVASRVNGEITMFFPISIFIGNNVHIGAGAFLDGRGGIIIGDNTHISRNLTLYTTNHNHSGEVLPYDYKYIAKEVVIGKNVWIGMNVCITPGVQIGDGAIIGMGAVISKDVGAGEIVVSGGQRVIGSRDQRHYLTLLEENKFGGISGNILQKTTISGYSTSPIEAKKVVFVLSTGRAGSATMAKMFHQESSVSAFHESFHFLLTRLSIGYQTGQLTKEVVKQKLIRYFSNASIVKKNTIYLESDQKLAPFIELLNEIFEDARFIWVIRSPKTFMHSATVRGWFKGDDPDFVKGKLLVDPVKGMYKTSRITGELTGEYTQKEWKELDQRIKVLWYWKYWNELIRRGIAEIPQKKRLCVRMEDLKNAQSEIKDFIGIDRNDSLQIEKTNIVLKKDRANYEEMKIKNYKFYEEVGCKYTHDAEQKFQKFFNEL